MANTKYPQIDYTSRDYASFKQDMVNLIGTRVPEWTNLSESDLGVVLMELFCHVADSLAYYQDRQANEAFLPSAKLRKNVINLCKLIDYQLTGAVPAVSDITLTVIPDISLQTIPAGSLVATEPTETEATVYFETLVDIVVPISASSVTASFTEGQSNIEPLGTSDGLPGQSFSLSLTPVILPTPVNPDAIVIEVDEGSGYTAWTRTDSLISASPSDKVWYYEEDDNGVVTVYFGDGITGKIPSFGSPIRGKFRQGGGIRGNVGAGTITVLTNVPSFVTACTNASNAIGGDDRETLDHARIYAPASLRRMDRAVTEDDYASVAQGYPGVLKAGVVVDTAYTGARVKLYILPTGGGSPTPTFLADLKAYIDTFKMATTQVFTYGAYFAPVDLDIAVTCTSGSIEANVEVLVQSAIASFFLPGSLDFAQRVNLSDIYRVIEEIEGVDYVDINKMTLFPTVRDVVSTGTPSFSDISVTSAITKELWTVRMVDASNFTVTGSVSGAQVDGSINNLYTNNAGTLTFKLNQGASPVVPGDTWTIRTSTYIGNIEVEALEVAEIGTFNLTVQGGI